MTSWLHHDHQQFETAIHRCRAVCDDEDWATVREVFDEFLSTYRMHVQLEEEVLFPKYEKRPETSSEPTESLREDHAQIFRLVNSIQDLLARGDWKELPHDMSLLYRSLIRHHEKEEEIFLPMASDVLLSDKDNIIAELKRRVGN